MKTLTTALALIVLLLSTGCADIDDRLKKLAAKPAATTIEEANALLDEAAKFAHWIEEKENPSEKQLKAAKDLVARRRNELLKLGGNTIISGVTEVLESVGIDIKSVDPGKVINWFTGIDNPKVDKFRSPGNRSPMDPQGAKGWP